MKKLIIPIAVAATLMGASIAFAQSASSTASTTLPNLSPVAYPIAALGNCASKDECKTYCDDNVHLTACMAFAEAHGLMTHDQATLATQIRQGGGPGGCTNKDSCRTYCDSHVSTCVDYGVKHKLITNDVASTTQALEAALKTGGGPGGCTTTQECKFFCANSVNAQVCLSFAQDHGFARLNHDLNEGSSTGDGARGDTHSSSTIMMGRDGKGPGPGDHGSSTVPRPDAHGSSTPPRDGGKGPGDGQHGSSTLPFTGKGPGDSRGSSTTPSTVGDHGSSTPPHGDQPFKNTPPAGGGGSLPPSQGTLPGGGPDLTQPPYHCTPIQAADGACEPDGPSIDESGNSLQSFIYHPVQMGAAAVTSLLHYYFHF